MYTQARATPSQGNFEDPNAILSEHMFSVPRVLHLGFSGQDFIRAAFQEFVWQAGPTVVFDFPSLEPPLNPPSLAVFPRHLSAFMIILDPKREKLQAELAAYVNAVAGSNADLDVELEAAAVEHLLADGPDEE